MRTEYPEYIQDKVSGAMVKSKLYEAYIAGEKQARWEVGEELCILIGNKMLEDMQAGILLGHQLEEYIKRYLKGRRLKSE